MIIVDDCFSYHFNDHWISLNNHMLSRYRAMQIRIISFSRCFLKTFF